MTVSTTQYEWTWGKNPRGKGNWWFFNGDESWSFNIFGTYAEAKKVAMAAAKRAGLYSIKVGT